MTIESAKEIQKLVYELERANERVGELMLYSGVHNVDIVFKHFSTVSSLHIGEEESLKKLLHQTAVNYYKEEAKKFREAIESYDTFRLNDNPSEPSIILDADNEEDAWKGVAERYGNCFDVKELRIEGVISKEGVTTAELEDLFIEAIEAKGIVFGGEMKEVEEDLTNE